MNINLNLTVNEYVRHGEIISLPVDKILLSFSSQYVLNELILTVKTADKVYQIRADAEHKADVTAFFTRAGTVDITVSMVIKGVVVKVWQIEPFIVKEISGKYVAIPELEYLKGEISTIKQALAEIVKTNS